MKLVIHPDHLSLHEVFPKAILPNWLGGNISLNEALDVNLMESIFSQATDDFYKKLNDPLPKCSGNDA
jgi:hypothetical protein